MRGSFSIKWKTPPATLATRVDQYGENLQVAVQRLADFFATRIEAYARANAPWQNRTGNARAGLRSFAQTTATRVVVYLLHTVSYGVFLERGTRFAAPRPIIVPTLEAHYAPFMAAVRRLIGG